MDCVRNDGGGDVTCRLVLRFMIVERNQALQLNPDGR